MLGLALLLTGAWLWPAPEPRIPAAPVLPPLPQEALLPAQGTMRVILRELHFTLALTQTQVRVPLVIATPEMPATNRRLEELRIDSLRIEGLRALAPIDTIITPIDAFTPIPGPRLRIRTFSLVDAEIGELADPRVGLGRWFYHARSIDLELRDVDVAGERRTPEYLRITRLDFAGEFKARPLQITRAAGTMTRVPERFGIDMQGSLGLTRLAVRTQFTPNDDFDLAVVADTIRFAELRAIQPALPVDGSGRFAIHATREGAAIEARVRHASAEFGASSLRASGVLAAGAPQSVSNFQVVLDSIRPPDIEHAFGIDLPDLCCAAGDAVRQDEVYHGVMSAAGNTNSGVRVNGMIVQGLRVESGPRVTLGGVVWPARRPRFDLVLHGDPIRLADTVFRAELRALGSLDTMGVRGTLQLAHPEPAATALNHGPQPAPPDPAAAPALELAGLFMKPPGDAPRFLRAHAWLQTDAASNVDSLRARAEGTVFFAHEPRVLAHVRLDSLPLHVLPWPRTVQDVRGVARGHLQLQGALAQPTIDGRLQIEQGELTVAPARLGVSELRGWLHVQNRRVVIDSMFARAADGDLQATGHADLQRRGALHIDVTAESIPVAALPVRTDQVDSLDGQVHARIALRGTMADPEIGGRATIAGARARIVATGAVLDRIHGDLDFRHDTVSTKELRARAGPGTLTLAGRASLTGGRSLDLRLTADSALLADSDSAHLVVSAELEIAGTAERPRIDGHVRAVDGWAREDLMKTSPVIDPERPPYARLAERVPWIRDSRLLPVNPTPLQAPPFDGRVLLEVTTGLRVIDEDSELRGRGEILLRADTTGIVLDGEVRFLNGFFANFGERFLIDGGGHRFVPERQPRLALRADNDVDAFVLNDQGSASPLGWYPAVESFVSGTATDARQQLGRSSAFFETQAQIAEKLLFGTPVEPITGWDTPRFWLPDRLSDLTGKRAAQQAGSMLWAYAADEAYEYLPLERAALLGGVVTIGSRFPGRIVQGPLFRLALTAKRRLLATASLAPEGSAPPGLRLRWTTGAWSLSAFTEPKFFAAPPSGESFPGYFQRRRTGLGLRWDQEF